jgi:maltose alpha-D-glucosyltransferase/alpha-amylase
MHHCLGKSNASGFGAETIDENDVESWRTRLETLLDSTLSDLSQNIIERDPFTTLLIKTLCSRRNKILDSSKSYHLMLGLKKIRTHQDLHLGQMLLKHGGETDFIITDFEGDPQRIDKARIEKECPIRDLGTMARSFSYLRYQVLADSSSETEKIHYQDIASQELKAFPDINYKQSSSPEEPFMIARAWEQSLRRSMLEGYLNQSKVLHDGFLPPETDLQKVDSISRLWELEKAILEARYEVHHRLQNIIIPIAGLLSLSQ